MQSIENRVNKLENMLIRADRFLVVFGNKGENKKSAIQRVMKEKEIKGHESDFYVIYLNLHGGGGKQDDKL